MNKKIAITTEWEIRFSEEQEQQFLNAIPEVLKVWGCFDEFPRFNCDEYEEFDWLNLVMDALDEAKLFSTGYLHDYNELFYVKYPTSEQFIKCLDSDEIPRQVWAVLHEDLITIAKNYIKNFQNEKE